MPDLLSDNREVLLWIVSLGAIAMAAWWGLRYAIRRWGESYPDLVLVIERGQRAFVVVAVIAATRMALLRMDEDSAVFSAAERLAAILFIAAVVWLTIEVLLALEAVALVRFAPLSHIDDVEVRKARTQIILVRRLIVAVVLTVGVGAALMTFPAVRVMGQGVLASAGLFSIVAGLAAQSLLTNVFAGIQLTLSNSMRVGDVVSVADESGTVGEITLTYVVLYLWDDRRLILPSSYFTSNPYENWTRRGGRIVGVIDFDVDWSAPLDALRAEFERVLAATPLWDGRKGVLFVSDVTEGRVRLRMLVSAANTDDMFSLNSHVREAMARFVADHDCAWAPRVRYEARETLSAGR